VPFFRADQILIGFLRPSVRLDVVQEIAHAGVTAFSVELMPDHPRPKHGRALLDGTVCGYKAVLLAADSHPRIFPCSPPRRNRHAPRVFVIGAGRCRTASDCDARRLGA